MDYKDLQIELNELQNEEFNLEFINRIMNVVAGMRQRYYTDLISKKSDDRKDYNEMAFSINNLLKNKLKEANEGFTNSNMNDIISAIVGSHLFVRDIIKLEDYIFIEGKSSFSFSNKFIMFSVNENLKDITSIDFLDCLKKVNYINSSIGKNTIKRVVELLNSYLKDYFNHKDDILSNIGNNITYNTPIISIKLNKSLDDICHGIIDSDIFNIDVVVMYYGEVYLFDLKLGSDFSNITEVDSDIWRLSEVNDKKKQK